MVPLEDGGAVGPADEVVLLAVTGETETPLLDAGLVPVTMEMENVGDPYGEGGNG